MTTNKYLPLKDPDAVLDYKFDWAPATNETPGGSSDWLASGETIETYTLTVAPVEVGGLVVDSDALTDSDTSVTCWLSGGTAGTTYAITCHIVTNAGREDDRTVYVPVAER